MLLKDLALAVINTNVIEAMKMNKISKVKSEKRAGPLETMSTEKCRMKNNQ